VDAPSKHSPVQGETVSIAPDVESLVSEQFTSTDLFRHLALISALIESPAENRSKNLSQLERPSNPYADTFLRSPLQLEPGTSLYAVNVSQRHIEGSVRDVDFSGAYFGDGVKFSQANLDGADISNRLGYQRRITGLPRAIEDANLSNSVLTLYGSTQLKNCKLEDSNVIIKREGSGPPLDLTTVSLAGSRLDIRSAVTLPDDLSRCSFVVDSRANIDISNRVVSGADLSNVLNGRVRQLALPSMQDLRSTTFSKVGFPKLDLSRSDMTGAELRDCDLTWVTLPQNLQGVVLKDCDLPENALIDKNLHGATLKGVTIEDLPTDLTNVTLIGVDLRGVDLSRHTLNGLTLVECITDSRTILPAELENVTFRDHQGPVADADYSRINWEFVSAKFEYPFPKDVQTSVTIGNGSKASVFIDSLDMSSLDMSNWRLQGVWLSGCTLPKEIEGARLEQVTFRKCQMPEVVKDSHLSGLQFDDSTNVADTKFMNNSYGTSAVADSGDLIPSEDALDSAAKRFFHPLRESDMAKLIPQLAPDSGKTYSLFWPRMSSPRHAHELHIRRASEDTWLVVRRDNEVRLNGSFLQEVFTFKTDEGLKLVEDLTRSNRYFSEYGVKKGLYDDLEAILHAKGFAGKLGPFMRITGDEPGDRKTHFFCAEGLPFQKELKAERASDDARN
jgi:uncharacterized protein YjbI with pentapeptide repeats